MRHVPAATTESAPGLIERPVGADFVNGWTLQPPPGGKTVGIGEIEMNRDPDPKIIDKEGLVSRLGDDDDFIQEILSEFADGIPALVGSIKSAIESRDQAALGTNAHTLKGSAGNVGAVGLQAIALAVENAGKASDFDQAAAHLTTLHAEVEKFQSEIQSWFEAA